MCSDEACPYEVALKTTAVPFLVCTMFDERIEDKRRHKCDGFVVLLVVLLVFSCANDSPILRTNLCTLVWGTR